MNKTFFKFIISIFFIFQTKFLFAQIYSINSDPTSDVCHENLTASPLMKVTRIDRHVPCSCKPFNINQFSESKIDYFVGGINSTKGADEKINLSRSEATLLWDSLNESKTETTHLQAKAELSKDVRLLNYYNNLVDMKDIYGFDFIAEGEILEALSILDLEKKYPSQTFFATGGIMYFNGRSTNVLGELDLVVYEKTTCSVVLVGEAKLSKGTSKAREQLARFRDYLRSQGRY